ncbi:MAG: YgeY family selenium metabolism-linked hydrolase [Chloroflexi bacterium]|nr:MAG: YgeY family selenium metabolism-linked hydrolase [Chloroflexota bacterium]
MDAVGARMTDLGFDEVRRDAMGNILGRIGNGPRVLLYDSHIDTVGVADASQWQWDPFEGKIEDGIIYGLGAGDEKCSTPPMIYAMAALKKLGLARDWTLYYFGNMEEWCDGISGNALVEHEGIRPDFVVIGESTNMEIYRGHRGRTEVSVTFKGRSCHASAPERGDNALYKAIPFIQGIERLHQELKTRPDPFLGAGSITVTSISTHSVSLNAVPDECSLYLDRRMHPAETKEVVLNELRALPNAHLAEIIVPMYEVPSYTGFVFPVEKMSIHTYRQVRPLSRVAMAVRRRLGNGSSPPMPRTGWARPVSPLSASALARNTGRTPPLTRCPPPKSCNAPISTPCSPYF